MGSGVGVVQPPISPPKTNARLGPSRSDSSVPGQDEERRRGVEVRMRLQTIHPNPVPRDKSEEARKRRIARRKEARKRAKERKRDL